MKLYHLVVGPIGTNCFLYADDNKITTIIDPGAEASEIINICEKNQLTPKAILLTHAHYDHIGAVAPLCEKYPEIKVHLHQEDLKLLNKYKGGDLPEYVEKKDYKNLKVDCFVTEGEDVVVGGLTFQVLHTPGHTLGGVCYVCGGHMFTGDTMFRHEAGRTDLEGGNYETLLHSLKKLHDLPFDCNVLPGHQGFSTLAEERVANYYVQQALK